MNETEGFEHEESLGPDDPGSMANKLARMAEKKPEDTSPAKTEEELAADATREAETKEVERVEAEAAAAAAAEKTDETPPEPPKPKFATVEEYEKAYKEAETKMHTATEEAAEERKAKEALVAENELTKKELAEVRAEQEAAAAEAAKLVPKAERKAAYAEALKKIKAIPLTRDEIGEIVYPPDYDDQVADAWAGTAVDPQEVAKEAAKIAREELKRERAGEEADRKVADAKTAEEKEVTARAQTRAEAEKIATEQGLDMTPGSADYRLFYSHVDELANDPKHEYRDKPFEEQVKWATGGVRQVLGKKIEMTDAERAAAKRNQERNAVLERGITRVVTAEKPKQRTMNEILTGSSLQP